LGPLQSLSPDSVAHNMTRQHSHEVSCPHSATHPPRFTAPGLCLPGSCCVLALTVCLDAFPPRRTPWCPFNQARSRGIPSELYLAEIAPPLGGTSPLAISYSDRRRQTLGLLTSFCFMHLHEIGRHKGELFGQTHLFCSVPLGLMVLKRFRRRGIAAAAASLQGFHPSVG
jgi:hypothetical protein